MSRHESRLPDYLEHMTDAVERVMEYTRGKSQEDFLSSRLIQDAVMRNLGVLGEAANNCFISECRRSVSKAPVCEDLWTS
jgi:uncharacterized protein with HEPN domain